MADAPIEEALTRGPGADDDEADSPPGEGEASRTETKAEKKARKREEKARERLEDAHRPLDSWERYRALCDTLKEANDLVDLADHKARFALVIMGALNAVMFIVAVRGQSVFSVPAGLQAWLGLGIVVYGLAAVYFFVEAIETLRPRRFEARQATTDVSAEDRPLGLRFYADVLKRDPAAYASGWRDVHIGQLNAEIAQQIYTLARINDAKYGALRRLYAGLKAMTLVAAVFLAIAAWFALRV
jgi:hypothetical protein